jgi:hypothetical protein
LLSWLSIGLTIDRCYLPIFDLMNANKLAMCELYKFFLELCNGVDV